MNGFDKYKYSCIDNSPIAVYISHPLWNWIVEFYPRWIAPNVLTLGGAIIVMSCYALVSWLDYDLNANSASAPPAGNLPEWVWMLCAVGTLLAHILDGTDGKQARRTGASGPTGELFDHGFDSWSTVPFTITIFSTFGRGEFSVTPLTLLAILISVQLVFIVSHWEKYNTGVLFLSWGYDASQYGLSLFYLVTYFVGHQAFQVYPFDGVNLAHFLCFFFFVSCALSLAMSIYNIHHAYLVTRTGKQHSIPDALLPLLSPLLLFCSALVWAIYSPGRVLDRDPRAFFWLMGVVFSNIAVHLIIAQMSSTKVPTLNGLLMLYVGLIAVSLSGFLFTSLEILFLRSAAIIFTLAHLHYGICVIRQLCDHFNIQPFSLSYLQKRKK